MAGLKAGEDCYEDSHEGRWVKRETGRPQWHDLRKNPDDLPKVGVPVLVKLANGEPSISCVSLDKRWFCTDYYHNTGETEVIKWKEIEND